MNSKQPLSYLVYVSRERQPLSAQDLAEILAQARDFNSQHQITGMLLYREGSFIQVLEGAHQAISELFARIAKDERHHQVDLVIFEPAKQRYFADWSMGFCDLARPDDTLLEGYSTFLREGFNAHNAPIHAGISTGMLAMFMGDYQQRTMSKEFPWVR